MNKENNRLIVALDMDSLDKMANLVEELGETVSFYKVGMELFYSCGRQAVEYLRNRDKAVFLDLKLHDIPNTVAKSVAVLTRLGVNVLDVHAAGGPGMMRAAAQAAANAAQELKIPRPKVIAITVPTSMNQAEWNQTGGQGTIEEQVVRLSLLARSAGLDGVVASPQEAMLIRQACGADFMIVTPGIRPHSCDTQDQQRVATPAGALRAGADYLVVGRPITAAENPKQAVKQILEEMRG